MIIIIINLLNKYPMETKIIQIIFNNNKKKWYNNLLEIIIDWDKKKKKVAIYLLNIPINKMFMTLAQKLHG